MSLFRGSKKLLVGLGLAGCGATAAVLFGLSNDSVYAVKAATLLSDASSQFVTFNSGPSPAAGIKWDDNWDMRGPDLSKGKFGHNYPKANSQDEQKVKATATRHLILIRHGQYNTSGKSDEERFLTSLGREQAKYAGFRLKELDFPITRIVQSTMTRARETAQIISNELSPDIKIESCDFLREGAPIQPEPKISTSATDQDYFEDGARIEAAFRRYFYRADASQKENSFELLVCHANVIRYFICRALQFPPEAWLRFGLHHCSFSWISIAPSGRVQVYCIGDSGHVPPAKMTTR